MVKMGFIWSAIFQITSRDLRHSNPVVPSRTSAGHKDSTRFFQHAQSSRRGSGITRRAEPLLRRAQSDPLRPWDQTPHKHGVATLAKGRRSATLGKHNRSTGNTCKAYQEDHPTNGVQATSTTIVHG